MGGGWNALTRWVTSPFPSTWPPKDIGKIRPSVARPTGTAIGQAKYFRGLATLQAFGALHGDTANGAFTQQLLYLAGNTLHADRLRDGDIRTKGSGGGIRGNIHNRSNYLTNFSENSTRGTQTNSAMNPTNSMGFGHFHSNLRIFQPRSKMINFDDSMVVLFATFEKQEFPVK